MRQDEDYLRCLEVSGNSEATKLAILTIDAENTTLPSRIKVKAEKVSEEFYFHKKDPNAEWGKIDFQLAVSDYVENPQQRFFRLYGNTQPSKETLEANQKETPAEKKDPTPEEGAPAGGNDAEETVINCPACTSFNPVTNTECEVCFTPLR